MQRPRHDSHWRQARTSTFAQFSTLVGSAYRMCKASPWCARPSIGTANPKPGETGRDERRRRIFDIECVDDSEMVKKESKASVKAYYDSRERNA